MDANFRFETAHRADHDAELHAVEPRQTRRADTTTHRPSDVVVEFGSGWYHEAAIAADKGHFAHPYR